MVLSLYFIRVKKFIVQVTNAGKVAGMYGGSSLHMTRNLNSEYNFSYVAAAFHKRVGFVCLL